MGPSSVPVQVTCYVRTSSFVAPVDATLRRLEQFHAEGVVEDITLGAWPAEVRLDDPVLHGDVVDLFEKYEDWATHWNVSIRPPFAVETRHSTITDTTRELLITPVQCLAVHVNGKLVEVFPHSTGRTGDGETHTVRDALALLDERAFAAAGPRQSPERPSGRRTATTDTPSDPSTCPACDTGLVTGQVVVACPNCDWTCRATGSGRYHRVDRHESPARRVDHK